MSRKFAAAAVMLLCLGALVASASAADPAARDTAPAPAGGSLMRRLLGASTFGHGLGLGSILGGGGAFASSSAYAGSGYGYPYGGGYDPYYTRPYYGGYNGYNNYNRRGYSGRRYYTGRKLMAMA